MIDPGGWLHDLNPFVLRISGDFGIRWYGLAYLAGFAVAYLLLGVLAARRLVAIPRDRVFDAIIILVAGVIIGGRVGYCLLYRPSYLWSFSDTLPFWNLIAINKGGMASHGGMIGVLIACVIIARGFKNEQGLRAHPCPRLHVADAVSLIAPCGLMLGRLANFINGELLGRIIAHPADPTPAPWWSIRYPQELLSEHDAAVRRTPEQAATLDNAARSLTLEGEEPIAGYLRLVDAVQHGDADVQAFIKPLISARHPSQIYQALAEGLVVAAVVWLVARKPRQAGIVSAWFLITYGLLRVLTEVYRLPDSHFKQHADPFDLAGATPLGLTRGQWYSVAMALAGLAILIWRSRTRTTTRYLGWARPAPPPA